MGVADLYNEPWLRFVPPGADAQTIDWIRGAWANGYRPTGPGGNWVLPGSGGGAAPTPSAAPTPPAPPAVAPPDYNALTYGDPEFIQRMAALMGQARDLGLDYGDASLIDIDPRTPGIQTDASLVSSASANPYSVVNQLKRQFQTNQSDVRNNANARGLLFSGANAQGQATEAQEAEQRAYEARRAFQQALGGIQQNQQSAYWDTYHRLASAPPGAGAAAPAAAPPAQPSAAATPAQTAALAPGYHPATPSTGASVNFTGDPNDARPAQQPIYRAPAAPRAPAPPRPIAPPKPKPAPKPRGR